MRVGGSGHAAVRSVRRCANAMQHTHVAVRACNASLLQRACSTACLSFRVRQVAAAANNIGNLCKRHGRAATALRCAFVPMAFMHYVVGPFLVGPAGSRRSAVPRLRAALTRHPPQPQARARQPPHSDECVGAACARKARAGPKRPAGPAPRRVAAAEPFPHAKPRPTQPGAVGSSRRGRLRGAAWAISPARPGAGAGAVSLSALVSGAMHWQVLRALAGHQGGDARRRPPPGQ